jgi:hypothetical protein
MSLKDYHLIKKITSYGDETRQLAKIATRLAVKKINSSRDVARRDGITRRVTDLWCAMNIITTLTPIPTPSNGQKRRQNVAVIRHSKNV